MSRQSVLSKSERELLLEIPDSEDELIRHYTLNELDLSRISQRRGDANRLGFAIQLCLLRYPGHALSTDVKVPKHLLVWVGKQIKIDCSNWPQYAERQETRREHLLELRSYMKLKHFGLADFKHVVSAVSAVALQNDKGIVLANESINLLRQQNIVLPPINVIERICAEAITRANRSIYKALTDSLTDAHRQKLDDLLKIREGSNLTYLAWLRQSPVKPNSLHMLKHIERLKTLQAICLPEGIERSVHQNRLIKISREGGK
jgi:TnpA family transposase